MADIAGEFGDDALKASKSLMRPLRSALAVPYVGLLLTTKLLAFLGQFALTALSPRIARDIPEIPLAVYVGVALTTLILHRYGTACEKRPGKPDQSTQSRGCVLMVTMDVRYKFSVRLMQLASSE